MIVTYYFREYRKGIFSIEMLFERVARILGKTITIKQYRLKTKNVFLACLASKYEQSDVNHITGDVNFLALALNGKKTVLTIHDLGHYLNTLQGWKKKVYKKMWLDWPLRKVAFVTTVSEFTRQQLLANTSLDERKVKVIYNPFPDTFLKDSKPALSATPKILQVGSSNHKNLNRLIESIKGLSVELMLVREYDEVIDRRLKSLNIPCSWHASVTEEEMYRLYKTSDILFFASLYEGFGMPIIEAQAVGRAVITSNTASMPEVGGEGVYLVNPLSVEEIRQALVTLITDHTYRQSLIEKGYNNLIRFQPDRIAQQYLDLYNQLAEESFR